MKIMSASVVLLLAVLFAAPSFAIERPYEQAQFDAMRAAGKPVAVVFHADWCPTCRAQAPILKSLTESSALKPLTLFVANFDTEKALRKSLGVAQQSTIVVFKDGKEVARSAGDTQKDSLAALLGQATS